MAKILSLVVENALKFTFQAPENQIFPEKATRSFLSLQSIAAYLPFFSFLYGGTFA